MLNLKIYAALGAVILLGGYFFKQYYDTSKEQILTLQQGIQAIELQNKAQADRYSTLRDDFALQSATITQLNDDMGTIRKESTRLSKTLARHELDKLAMAKPGLIKIKANKATAVVFKQLEKYSQPVEKKK